ncbi:LysE family translocator [Streptomyces sp. NRRL S-87]|uniref:LysE family translocator n=1 Tax=Streptomyces sp. NRRL S-87 TaxID=1463920 RepID=UPI0004C07253|nr:LysE family translocator [Streptomyces sp. NRRL S-87]
MSAAGADPYAVAGFLAALLPLVATPGASLALLVRHVSEGGRRRAVPVALGTVTGLYVHAGLAAAGLSALVASSGRAFAAVRLAGACYLVGLGLWTWYGATRAAHAVGSARACAQAPAPARARSRHPRLPRPVRGGNSPYAQALLGNVLNPKAASIYLTLVPQFVAPGRPFAGQALVLASAHAALMVAWLGLWAGLVGPATALLRRPRARVALARGTAAVLVTLGLRTAAAT